MKSLKKTLVLLVVLSMILSAVSPVFAFSDVIPEEYAEQANKMAAFGVFTGDANGNFNAEENITRAEMAVVIGRLMGLTTNEANANQGYTSNFSDVAAGEWYTGWVNLVAGKGIISGFPDGTFRPNEKVTQAQAVTMIVKALGWGVVVDQTGTWPANYITKASELRLFKNAADQNGELVTRGNVAIYCYNALTAKTWDVTESTNGELTSSARETATILEKYFSDFTNDAGALKLVEDVVVYKTPVTDKTIGTNQIVFQDAEVENKNPMATFLGLKNGGKNKEEKTYIDTTNDVVVAYVEADVNLGSLANKTVDVIFGKDNKIVYLAVTNDAVDGAYVTAWDGEEIEIDGEVYEFADSFAVSVFGTQIAAAGANITVINNLFYHASNPSLKIADADRAFNRAVKANVILDENEEIVKIDFMFAEDYTFGTTIQVENYIVKSISSKGKINAISTNVSNTNILGDEFEKIEDKVRVIKNNEIVSLEDIEVGDVLTLVYSYDSTNTEFVVDTVYVASDRATGEITRLKTNNYTLDGGDVYYTVNQVIGDSNGDIEDAEDVSDLKVFYGEEVEFYLNFMGEVVAVVASTEATDSTLGIVTTAATEKTDADDVDYLSVRILTEDGEARYKVYNKKAGENYDDAATYGKTFTKEALAQGAMVIFAADADNIIKSNEIEVVDGYEVVAADTTGAKKVVESASAANEIDKATVGAAIALNNYVVEQTEYVIGTTTVEKVVLNNTTAISDSKQKVTQNNGTNDVDYKFGSAVLFNTKADDEEVINGWSSICKEGTTAAEFKAYAGTAFVKKTDSLTKNVLFYAANITKYVAEDAEYAALVDIEYTTNEDEEDVYVVTLFIDGEEVEYEADSELSLAGLNPTDFVTFELSDGEITKITKIMDIYAISKLDSADAIDSDELKYWNTAADPDAWAEKEITHKGLLEVGAVYETYFEYVEKFDETTNTLADLDINEDGYVIYDLREGFDMFDGDLTEVEGLYVYGFETEVGEGYDVFVIVD